MEPDASLTPSEYRLLTLKAKGMGYREMAHELGISPSTVRNHLTAIFRKLGVGGQVEAFIVMGWLRAPE